MKEYVFDEPLTGKFLNFLEKFGTFRSLGQPKRPYFEFEKEQSISIKGFTGDCNDEVRHKKEFQDHVADYIQFMPYYGCEGVHGIAKLKSTGEYIREKLKTLMIN